MTNQPLYTTNAHGDIWQEPTLFDQPAELEKLANAADDEWAEMDDDVWPDDEDDDFSYSEATGDYGQYD